MKEETTVSLAAADNTDDEVSADAAAFYFVLIRTGHHFLDKRRRKIRKTERPQSWPCVSRLVRSIFDLFPVLLCVLCSTESRKLQIIYAFPKNPSHHPLCVTAEAVFIRTC